jgi:hypothetical protein
MRRNEMKSILRFTQALVLLALIVGCSGIPEGSKLQQQFAAAVETPVAEAPTVEPTRRAVPPLSDLVPTSMTIMEGDGITDTVLDDVPMILVLQGATMIVSAHVFIDNTATGGEDSFDRDAVEVRFEARLVNAGDAVDPNAETSYEEVIEYDDYQPVLGMDRTGVHSGLRETALLNADKFVFPDDFDAVESLSDHMLAENEPTALTALMAASPESVENILLEQQPRIRYFNAGGHQGVNNHLMPIQQYALNYVAEIGDYERHCPWVVYTFEIGTGALANGDWEISVQVDHHNEIPELDESNNVLKGIFTIHPPSTDWAPAFDAWWEEQQVEASICDPWGDEPAPTKFDTEVTRVRHYDFGDYDESANFGFWADQGMARVLRTQMYVTEFWGPHGSGRQGVEGNWVEYYSDMGGDFPRPAPEDVENVFLFLSGNGGCRTGKTTIATGQDNYYCNFTGRGTSRRYQLRIESWPGQLVYKQPQLTYAKIYSPSNSLLTMAFQHVGTAGYSSRVQRQNAEGFVEYLIDRTEGFKNVRNIWLGGNSRGGAIAIRLARIIKRRIVQGDPSIQAADPEDIRIIVTAADAVSLSDRDDLYYHSRRYICGGTGDICYDAQTHELDRAFPFHEDPAQDYTHNLFVRQAVGSSKGLDSMVQYYHDNRSHWNYWMISEGLPGEFYTQNMQGFAEAMSHKEMCRTWKQINAISNIQFFFRNALDKNGNVWDPSFVPYPDGCP